MITQPGMGIWNMDNSGPRRDEINHTPMCGTPQTGSHWCKVCRKLNHYSWVDVCGKCEACKKRKKNKPLHPIASHG